MTDFDAWWAGFPHPKAPRSRGSKPRCKKYWSGQLRTEGGDKILPIQQEAIMRGTDIHREAMNEVDPMYWPMAATFLYQERWETLIEQQEETTAEEEQRLADMTEAEKRRQKVLEFNRAYQKRKIEENRKGNPYSMEQFKAELAEQRAREQGAQLRLVGED